MAKLLADYFRLPNDETFFLAGLIHDVGKVVVDRYFHEEFLQVLGQVAEQHIPFSKAERGVLGTTHYQIAAKLLHQWNFPSKIVMEVLYHHAPWHDKKYQPNSIVIYLANILTKLAGLPFYDREPRLDLKAFCSSAELDFVSRCGFELDYESLKNLIRRIRAMVEDERNNVMSLFS